MKLPLKCKRPLLEDDFLEETEWNLICLAYDCARFHLKDYPGLFHIFITMQDDEGLIDYFGVAEKIRGIADIDFLISFFRGLGHVKKYAKLGQFEAMYGTLLTLYSELHWLKNIVDLDKALFEKATPENDTLQSIVKKFKPQQLLLANNARQNLADQRDRKIFKMILQIKSEIKEGNLSIKWELAPVKKVIISRLKQSTGELPHGYGDQTIRMFLKGYFTEESVTK